MTEPGWIGLGGGAVRGTDLNTSALPRKSRRNCRSSLVARRPAQSINSWDFMSNWLRLCASVKTAPLLSGLTMTTQTATVSPLRVRWRTSM